MGVLEGEVGQPGEAAGGFVEGVEVLHLIVLEDVQGEVFGVEEPEAFGDDEFGDGGDNVGGGEGLARPVEFELAAGVAEFEGTAASFLDEGVEGGEPDGEEGEVEALGGVADAALGVGQGGGGQAHEDGDGEGEGAGDADDVKDEGDAHGVTHGFFDGVIGDEGEVEEVAEAVWVGLGVPTDVEGGGVFDHGAGGAWRVIPEADPAGLGVPDEEGEGEADDEDFPAWHADGFEAPEAEPEAFPERGGAGGSGHGRVIWPTGVLRWVRRSPS